MRQKACDVPDRHPVRNAPPVVYFDSEGRPWKRIKNLKSSTQDSKDFVRYGSDEAMGLLAVGCAKSRKTVYP